METFIVILLFAASMGAMSVGVALSGRRLRGSCGGSDPDGHDDGLSCSACVKKEAAVCPTDNDLVRLAQIAHPDPKHHR